MARDIIIVIAKEKLGISFPSLLAANLGCKSAGEKSGSD
jgi:hypothetical protein